LHAVSDWRPDVLHVFGATLDLNLMLSARLARRQHRPMVVHYHGGLPDADIATRAIRRHNLRAAARVLFTSRAQAEPWIRQGLLARDRVAEVMETSTPIRPIPRARARAITGIRGDPACLLVGRLHPVKDPVTALTGFALLAEHRPLARLYVYSLTDELRGVCEALVAAIPGLADRVEFRGRVPPEAMPAVYSSADALLHASRREWSSQAVLEAMACGVIPVVSDIPSLRRMTAGGSRGRLFPVGDAAGLARAALELRGPVRGELSAAVRSHFERALSFEALARDCEGVYREVVGISADDH
jgi:glycosyltransferase involved in cell wall biosynthesis